jgi:hypothetical protein
MGSPSDAPRQAAFVVDTTINEEKSPDSGKLSPGSASVPVREKTVFFRVWSWVISGQVPDAWCFGISYVILLPFFLAPLFATKLLPGLDLPFHLAAADMLSKLGQAASPYASYYDGGLRIAPYAAHFVALVGLGKVMNLMAAHKLIIILYVAGLPLAMASLLASCRRSRIPALLAFPLAYNLSLHYGFVSFVLSLPVVLLLQAEMMNLVRSESRRAFIFRWFVTAAIALLLFLCHLQNFLYGVCASLVFAVLAVAPIRRKLVAAMALVPAFAGLAYWHFTSPPVTGQAKLTLRLAWTFLKRHRLEDLGPKKWLNDLWGRILLVPMHAMRSFVDEINVIACKVLCLIILAYILIGLFAWPSDSDPEETRVVRRERMRLAGLIVFLGALFAYLALPHHLQEMELMTFFPRFAVMVLLTSLLLIPATLLRFRGLLKVLLPLPIILFGIFYGRQLYRHYQAYGAEVAGFVDVVMKTPPGGKVLGLVFDRRSDVMLIESTILGLPSFYPAMRPALGSMVPPTYCGLRHMPCKLKVAPDFITNAWNPASFSPAKMLPLFDYFFVRSLPPRMDLFRGYHGMVEPLAQSGTWAVFRKKPGPVVPDPPPPPPPRPLVPAPLPVAPSPMPLPQPAVGKLHPPMRKALSAPPVSGKLAPPPGH